MTCDPIPSTLTDEQQAQICAILTVGCDRQTAADYVGCGLADIRNQMHRDPAFLARVLRAEASAEFNHMRNVQESAREKKDWRASVWWLERRSPERFARRDPGTITVRQLKTFVAMLTDTLANDVTHTADRERVLARLHQLAESANQIVHDAQGTPAELATATAGKDSALCAANPVVSSEFDADSADTE